MLEDDIWQDWHARQPHRLLERYGTLALLVYAQLYAAVVIPQIVASYLAGYIRRRLTP